MPLAATRTGRTVSHDQIGELLGTGGMGDVYRATDVRLGRPVALKFLRPFSDPVMRRRLMREARAAAELDHPNICTIFEVDETPDGEVFIVMACYEGSCPRPTTPGTCWGCATGGSATAPGRAMRTSSASRR